MSLIPQITEKRFQSFNSSQIKELPSLEIVDEKGDYLATLIVPSVVGGFTIFNEIKVQAEFLGVRGNIVVPPKVIESLNEPPPQYPNLVKAREARRLKQKVGVV